MVFILIVTHGKAGMELVKSAELIIGSCRDVQAFGLEHGDDVVQLQKQVADCVAKKREEGFEVLTMCDLLGGSPYNVIATAMIQQDFPCVTGVNLPMLIEAIDSREDESLSANELAELCTEAARRGIVCINREKLCGSK